MDIPDVLDDLTVGCSGSIIVDGLQIYSVSESNHLKEWIWEYGYQREGYSNEKSAPSDLQLVYHGNLPFLRRERWPVYVFAALEVF